jgi:hypothetical protein
MSNAPYSFQHSLGTGGPIIIEMAEQSNLAIQLSANAEFKPGQFVKLVGDESCEAVTAATDVPVGVVVASEHKQGTDYRCTIQTPYQMLVHATASGNLAAGAAVAVSGFDTPNERPIAVAAGSNTRIGTVLVGGNDTEDILIGVLRSY